ncbi:hypothetical protein L218DRAFT_409982 [Marasmius fiardii PR-910]|nr:hypothetical protein L218DRAFT_409982 [Marasmius fiardii PR-910]
MLDSLSTSNDSPSPNELATLTGEYEAISRAIPSLDSEITLLQAKLGTLEQQRQELVSSLGVYKSVLNPCRRLPSKILTSIFGLCVKEDVHTRSGVNMLFILGKGGDYCPSSLDTRRSPWVLGQVCRRWRNLVLSLPDLWSAIEINCRQPPKEIFDPFIERRLSLTLQRSRERPLHILWSQWS